LDGVEDYVASKGTIAIIELFKQMNVPFTAGVISNHFASETLLRDLFFNQANPPIDRIEIASNGYDFENFGSLFITQQRNLLNTSANQLNGIFKTKTRTFIPPSGSYNFNTVNAMASVGMTHFSTRADNSTRPYPLTNQVVYQVHSDAFTSNLNVTGGIYRPAALTTIWRQIFDQLATDGFSVVTMHGGEFLDFNASANNYNQAVNKSFFDEMKFLIASLQRVGMKIVKVNQINDNVKLQPIVVGGQLPPYVPPSQGDDVFVNVLAGSRLMSNLWMLCLSITLLLYYFIYN